jgi:hypothetical protein
MRRMMRAFTDRGMQQAGLNFRWFVDAAEVCIFAKLSLILHLCLAVQQAT